MTLVYDETQLREPNLLVPHRKPIGPVRLRSNLPGLVSAFWDLRGSTRNLATGRNDGTEWAQAWATDANGPYLDCDGTNGGAYAQSSRRNSVYTTSDDFSLVALVKVITFAGDGYVISSLGSSYRDVGVRIGNAGAGRVVFDLDTTGTDQEALTDPSDATVVNWDWGLVVGRSKGGIPSVRFKSLPLGTGNKDLSATGSAWTGNVGGETVTIGGYDRTIVRTPSANPVAWGGICEWYINDAEFMEIWRQGIAYFLEPA